jgi:hypothetical protein
MIRLFRRLVFAEAYAAHWQARQAASARPTPRLSETADCAGRAAARRAGVSKFFTSLIGVAAFVDRRKSLSHWYIDQFPLCPLSEILRFHGIDPACRCSRRPSLLILLMFMRFD